MKRITLDDVLLAKLGNLVEDAELCDENGRVVGWVSKSMLYSDPNNWEELTPDITEEEWQRICASGDYGISTQELINHLKAQLMYRVAWGPEIIDKISKVYDRLNDSDRELLMVALETIDAALLDHPMLIGESRERPEIRVAIEPPLMITFRINESKRAVRVSGVRFIRRPNR